MAPRTPEEEAAREAWARSQGMGHLYGDPPAPPVSAPLTLAQILYPHLRVNESKQPFTYTGNPVLLRTPNGKTTP